MTSESRWTGLGVCSLVTMLAPEIIVIQLKYPHRAQPFQSRQSMVSNHPHYGRTGEHVPTDVRDFWENIRRLGIDGWRKLGAEGGWSLRIGPGVSVTFMGKIERRPTPLLMMMEKIYVSLHYILPWNLIDRFLASIFSSGPTKQRRLDISTGVPAIMEVYQLSPRVYRLSLRVYHLARPYRYDCAICNNTVSSWHKSTTYINVCSKVRKLDE